MSLSPEALMRTIHMAQLSAQWERAKGELNALAAMLGARPIGFPPPEVSTYQAMLSAITEFVDRVEGEELHTGGCDW